MGISRRDVLAGAAAGAVIGAAGAPGRVFAAGTEAVAREDRVLVCNEDSNTLTVIDPARNAVAGTVNLTSFDEDPRPPFRFATGGTIPTHAAMVTKPLYHGAINIHGGAPSPDQTMAAVTGRGTSNIYLIDVKAMAAIGNGPNPQAGETTLATRLTSGVLVGREPHEPTWSRNGKEIWVALRGESRIAIVDTELARRESAGENVRAVRGYVPTILGPAQVWFSKDGSIAFVISQKVPMIEVFDTGIGADGFSNPKSRALLDIREQDPFGFTPFQKVSPDGQEMWFSHKIGDGLSARGFENGHALLDHVPLGEKARPNHVEFVENAKGKVIYASLGRIDDDGPGGVASSRIAIIDRSAPAGRRSVAGHFFSHGRESHGLWTNPDHTLLYVAHEQDELPGTPHAGQTVCSAFDVSDPFAPRFVAQIPLGHLDLPSGKLRNKKSINLVYFRPGSPMHSG
ncbi:YncE family protein [Nisaea sediminum]|uniref:YncE family protein n=1 Tax=Nisaea sediminum TaxID=2775867 RepID=UPI00186720DD|nr:YncE family protein [Nisaea sediminum]